MTPDLALILSFEGIALLERADGGWRSLGEADPADPDLGATLARLRSRADCGAPYPTKLILPAEQIRFMQQDGALGPEEVRAALEGATPYAVEDLTFDWLATGSETLVAATARQTIREAEEFARAQGFLPVSVVGAVPEDAHDWEPFFGAASGATEAEALAEEVEADEEAAVEEEPVAELPEVATEEPADVEDVVDATPAEPEVEEAAPIEPESPPENALEEAPAPDPLARQNAERLIALTNPVARSPQRVEASDDEARRLTIFGARTPTGAERSARKPPRTAMLALTALVLLGGAGVAAVATGVANPLLTRFWPAPTAPEITETALEPELAPAEPDLAAFEPEPVAPESPAPTEPPAAAPPALDPEALDASYAATGIWQAPPAPLAEPVLPEQGEIQLAAIDPRTVIGDAIALPDAESLAPDDPLPAPANPAPADTTFDLDADGRVRPTPEGALTPDGIMVHLGPPPVTPPPTPERADEDALRAETSAALQQALHAAVRPLLRPENLIEENERAQFGGRSRAELAGIRPLLRPRSLQDETQDRTPTAQAVATSPVPRSRPSGFDAIVARAQPAPEEPKAPAVPAAAAIRATAPSGASVARQATVDNVLRLNQVNLIGVYGVPSNRRALIRLSNGRYVKVEVGDTLDGGRVAAIGESELRYVKKGRNVVLRMPKG